MSRLQDTATIAIDYLCSKDGVKGDVTVWESEQHEITMKDGKFTLYRTLFDENIYVKVLKDNKEGSSKNNKFNEEAVKQAIDEAISSAEVGEADECHDIAPGRGEELYEMGVLEPDIDKLIARTKELSDTIAKRYKKIKLIEMITKYVRTNGIFLNTNGTREEKHQGAYQVMVEFAGNDGENSTSIAGSWVTFDSLDKELITLGSIEKDLEDAENSLNPKPLKDKFVGDVIFTPACTAQVLWFILANTVTDGTILNKTSLWYDKIGEQVASPLLTIGSNTWDDRILDHETHTWDGFKTEDYTIIEKGVLKSYGLSLFVSNKTGFERAKNSADAMVVEPGETPYEDMVKSIKKGLIVGNISCGMPGTNGEISGVAKNAFYVEDGEIKGAVIETMISGNLFDMVKNITAICDTPLCNGASVIPAIQVSGITITG